MSLDTIVKECLLQHEGGERFFDALDERIRNSSLIEAILMKAVFNRDIPFDAIIVSGKFGLAFKSRCLVGYPSFEVIRVNGSLRGDNLPSFLDADNASLRNKRVIFIDDSFYSGTTRNKIADLLTVAGATLVATYAIYDGSKEKDSSVYSLYRYYDHY